MREPIGVILAGGRGTRMGTVSKAGVMLGGESLLQRCEDRLAPQCDGIVVIANADVSTSYPVISDSLAGYLGPLAGILAGLDYAQKRGFSHCVTAAVDTPFFPCDLTPKLILAGLEHPDGFAIAATVDGLQGTFGIWPVTLRAALEQYLQEGQRKVRSFAEAHAAATAHFAPTKPDAFFNANTPEELEAAQKWL